MWHGGSLSNSRAASPLMRLVEVEERWVAPEILSRVFSLEIVVEPSQKTLSPVWCSKLRIKTGVLLAPCRDGFRGPCSDATVDQVR
ncbi:hypothetical protein TNCV_2168751 [Trichonephila clavipes]|nr:hypothetical protein TNCV_2168751 [Trichonephila clavipes]